MEAKPHPFLAPGFALQSKTSTWAAHSMLSARTTEGLSINSPTFSAKEPKVRHSTAPLQSLTGSTMMILCCVLLWLVLGYILSCILAAVFAPIALVLVIIRVWHPAWVTSFLLFNIYAYTVLFYGFFDSLYPEPSSWTYYDVYDFEVVRTVERSRRQREEKLASESKVASGICFMVQVVWLGMLRFGAQRQEEFGYVGRSWKFPAHLVFTFSGTAATVLLVMVLIMLGKRMKETFQVPKLVIQRRGIAEHGRL